MAMNAPTVIGVAVVRQGGLYLVGVRPDDAALGGMSEFPGGKRLPGETPRDAAARECREETGLDVEPRDQLAIVRHAYPHGDVELHFWLCVPREPAATSESYNGFRWVAGEELRSLPFPDANASVVALLTE